MENFFKTVASSCICYTALQVKFHILFYIFLSLIYFYLNLKMSVTKDKNWKTFTFECELTKQNVKNT